MGGAGRPAVTDSRASKQSDGGLTLANLDPEDWEEFRRQGHRALDAMIDFVRDVRSRPVWQPMPEAVRERFRQDLPRNGRDFAAVLTDFETLIQPYANGNVHPLFMGWVHGAGTAVGMVAEMLAAGLNSNCGGRDHIGPVVEQQITLWAARAFGFPSNSSGVFVTGTSMANFLGLLVARNQCLGHSVREFGLGNGGPELIAYASSEAHGCIAQAMDLAGIGTAHLRLLPVDSRGALCCDRLSEAIISDQQKGLRPFLIVGTAGSVNTGAIDDLSALADIAQQNKLWLHVDGAFGALAVLSESMRPRLAGIERADSIAFDFHKWAHVPYDAGFLLVRDPSAHYRTFASPAAYLSRTPRGLGAGDVWPCDLGPDLSRGFRALKTWFTFEVFGADQIGACISENCRVARYLGALLEASTWFELCAPVSLNIVCFTVNALLRDEINEEIVMELHTSGWAAPSITRLNHRPVIRAAIVNHRTTTADMDQFLTQIVGIAEAVAARQNNASR
jgi:aromatic-L-amino-acid/L-tryptophan decarboxylase